MGGMNLPQFINYTRRTFASRLARPPHPLQRRSASSTGATPTLRVPLENRHKLVRRGVILWRRGLKLVRRGFVLVRRRFVLVRRGFVLVRRWIVLVRRGVVLVRRRFVLVRRRVVLVRRRVVLVRRRVVLRADQADCAEEQERPQERSDREAGHHVGCRCNGARGGTAGSLQR